MLSGKNIPEPFAGRVTAPLSADITVLVGTGTSADGDFEVVDRAARETAVKVTGAIVARGIHDDHDEM